MRLGSVMVWNFHSKLHRRLIVYIQIPMPLKDLTVDYPEGNPNERLYQATLDDFFSQRESNTRAILNFMDLPLNQSSVSVPMG